jgi:hypothetical protein
MTEQNVSNRENYRGNSDSHPHGVAYFTCGQLSRSWRNIPITLTDTHFGEQTAQAGVMA